MENVSKYADLFDKLSESGWSRQELEGLASVNFIRVLKEVEKYRDTAGHELVEAIIPKQDLVDAVENADCRIFPASSAAT